ncbi:MAG: PH domain-containing protein, partial [Candidatus Micrarchaeota archaeon]
MSTETLVQKYPLKWEKILKKTVNWMIFPFLILGVLAIAASLVNPLFFLLFILFILPLSAVVYWYHLQYFKSYFYDLTDEGMVTSKGVFGTHKVIVPPEKVQDVYLDQDFFDRVFGLWNLHVSSATGTSGAEAHIDGVSEENAREMRKILMSAFTKEEAEASSRVLKSLSPSKMGLLSIILGAFTGLLIASMFIGPFALLFFVPGIVWAYLDFSVLRYELRENGVFVRRGFINRSENLFLYRNIQDVEEIASFLDRILGLKTLSIKTMTGTSTTAALMPYIDAAGAPKLRKEVIDLAKKASQKAEEKKGEPVVSLEMEVDAKEKPLIEGREMLYKNRFYKGALYSSIFSVLYLLPLVLIALVILVAVGNVALIAILILGVLAISGLITANSYLFAFIRSISYDYRVTSDFIRIKTGILNIVKKQINYNKIQDIEKRISFTQSFAKLATLKLETGSKELIGSGKNQRIGSMSTQNETVPDLDEKDAEELKKTILSQMGISLHGIGRNPLVSKLPLETVKPLKKTLWWIIYSTISLIIISGAILFFAPNTLWLAGALFIALSIICIVKYVYECYYYKNYFYDVNDDVLIVKKGVFGSRELIIPFDKIQDVFVDRDWLDLAFGLYDVYVSTVSSRSMLNAHLDGLNNKNAGE